MVWGGHNILFRGKITFIENRVDNNIDRYLNKSNAIHLASSNLIFVSLYVNLREKNPLGLYNHFAVRRLFSNLGRVFT